MKIEALVELVRALGQTVQQLSGLVEGMPKALDAKLASMRDSLLGEVRQVRTEMSSLRLEFADIQTDNGALRAMFDTTRSALREETTQIIADNRVEFSTQLQIVNERFGDFDQRISNVGSAVDEFRRQTEASFEESRAALSLSIAAVNKSIEEQHAFASNVRTACDTTDLYHSVKKLEAAVATGEEGHLELTGKVDVILSDFTVQIAGLNTFTQDLAKQISDGETVVLDWRKEDAVRLDALSQRIDTVDASHTKSWAQLVSKTTEDMGDIRATISQLGVDVSVVKESLQGAFVDHVALGNELRQGVKDVAGHAAEARTKVDQLTLTVENTTDRVVKVETAVQAVVLDVENQIKLFEETDVFTRAEAQTMVDASQQELNAHIADVAVQITANWEALSQRITELPTPEQIVALVPVEITRAEVRQLVATVEENALAAVAKATADLGQQIEATAARVATIEESAVKYVAATEDLQQVVEATLQAHTKALENVPTRDEVETNIEVSRQNMLSSLTAATVETQAARSALVQCRDTLPKLEEMLDVVGRSVTRKELETAIGGVRDGVNARFADMAVTVDTMAGSVRGLWERIDTLPPPFDPEPLKQWVGEQFKEYTLSLPELSFDVATGEDQTALAFTFGIGDKFVTKQVPLNIGLRYRGVYDRDEDYTLGTLVTYKGSMWYAKVDKPATAPGKDEESWQLAVKCGRDGKDAPAVRSLKALRDPNTGLASEYRLNYETDPPEPDEHQ